MANSDKDIRIVPNRNKSGLPNIAFTGYNNDPIVLNVLDDNTISFEGSSGQLFSVSNAVTTGTIFSVNDISGIPSFRIDADGTVGIAEFSGNVGIGLQSPQSKLSVGGDINVGAGYTFRVAGTKVLDSFSLGTGVTQSSLTSLGTITSGTWQGTAIGVNYGGTGATNASDARSFLGAATAGTNSDLTRLLGVQHLFVTIPTAAAIGITVKAATSQASNMMEFVNSSNTVMSWITKDGTFAHGAYFTHNDGRVPGFSVQRSNAAGIVARGFNSDAFPAIEVQNNPGSLTVGLYPSGLVYGGVLQAYASTASTNTTTGALIVAGGAAIAGTTNFGRDVRIFSSLASSSPFTGSLVVSGGVGISNNLFVGGGVAFTASIASTSTSTGTLVVTGGVGIGGSVFTSTSNASSISGVVLSNGSVSLTGTYTQSNSSTTAFSVKDGSNTTAFNIDTIGDVISLPVAVASTSTNSGSLVVAGGVGIGGTANIRSAYVYNDLLHIPGTGNTFGMSFTSFTLPTGFTGSGLYAIYAENRFVATGGSVVAYSDDLINWTTSYIPWNASVYNQSITYGNGVYVVTSSVNSYVAYSRDLLTWTLASVQYQNYQTAAYGNGRFVINAGSVVGISTNGANWSSLSPTGSAPNYQALKFQNGYFYSSSSRSVDGIAWEPLNISISVGNISYGNGLYFGAQYNSSNYAYSYDGVNFTTATIANNVYVGTEYHNGVYYLRTQHNNAILYYSTDGLNYQGLGFGGVGQFAMAFGKNKIVVFGRDGSSGVYGYYAEGTNGKIDLNPIREGNIDNTVIGSRTPKPANFTDLSTTGYVNIVNRAGSASTTSGALVVRGGVGIGGSLYVASPAAISGVIINSGTITGSLTGTATTATYSHQSGYAITSGFATSSSTATLASSASTSYSVNVNSALTNSSHYLIFSPNTSGSGIALSTESSLVYNPSTDILSASGLAVTSGTPSTSTTTGALVVVGGVGIGQSLFTSASYSSSISGAIFSNGSATLSGSFTQNNSSTTAFQVRDASNNPAFVIDTIGDIITLPVAVASTSTGTGSLVVAGGVGIGGSVNIGGRVAIGTSDLGTSLSLSSYSTSAKSFIIRKLSSQTSNLLEIQDAMGQALISASYTAGSGETGNGVINIHANRTISSADNDYVLSIKNSNTHMAGFSRAGQLHFFANIYGTDGSGNYENIFSNTYGNRLNIHKALWHYGNSIYFPTSNLSIYAASTNRQSFAGAGSTSAINWAVEAGPWTSNTRAFGIISPGGADRTYFGGYGNLVVNITGYNSSVGWDETNLISANIDNYNPYTGFLAKFSVSNVNRFTVGPYGNTTVALGGTTVSTGFIIKAASSQTGNLFEAQSSTGATITFIDASGDLSIGASTASTSSTTGALIVAGGVGIGQTLNVAGNATIGGTLNVSGTNSYIQNNLYVGNNTQGRLYFSQATLGSAGTTVIPSMAFIGATNSPITLSVLPDNSLSFDGSSGQLFSINNNLSTGWIFAINDISGLPIFRTNADLTVAMGEYGGNVGIGLSNPTFKLQVSGNAGISGTALISNTTASTNTTSGALVVSGGVGIGGSLFLSSSVSSSLSGVVVNNGVVSSGSWAGNAITVNYGGTGYNSYTKGDILVGAGSTFIKLNVGTDNYVLTALSTAATGLTWSPTAATGITTLNGLNTGLQYLAIGYSGSVPSFSSSGSTHTLNIPIAGTGSTGLVSTQSQSFAGIKTFTNAVSITDNTGSGTYTAGALTVTGGVGIGGTLNVQGDFNVQGTFTTINSTTLNVADKNIELGVVTSPSDLTAEGGGITLKGATDKLLNWYSGVGWSSSESFNLASTNTFKINNTTVLSSSSLGTGVTNSSLTALGTITTGTWSATTISPTYGGTGLAPTFTVGDLLYANTSSTWGRLSASSNSGYILSSAGSGATPTYVNPLSITVGLASTSNYADQSGYGLTSGLATTATYSHQSGYAITSGSSNTSGYATTSGLATTATYSHQSGYGITAGLATTATYAHQSGYAITSGSSSTSNFATSSGLATTATYAHQSGYAITSTSSGSATTATNVNVSAANTNSSHPVLFTPATGTASGAALSTETSFVYNPSTDILSVSGISVTSTTPATSFTSGALIVSGGAGIAGSIWANSIAIGATLSYAAPNLLSSFSSSVNSYSQVIIQNKSNGASASADFVVNNNLSTDTTYYGNLGMNSSGFTGSGSLSLPNAVYLSSTTGDLVIGSTTANLIRFVYNSGATDTMQISGTGVSILSTTSSTSATTGALTISGGVGIGQSLYTSPSFASSISGVILNNGAITNTGTITSTGVMTISNSSTSAFAVRDASNNSDFNVDTIAGVVTVTSTTGSTNVSTGALVVRGGMGVSGDVFICGNANSKLNIMQSSGDEGGEIFLNKPVTNTTISNGVSIDIYQNRLRFFENGGSNRGYYIDITAGGNGVTTNLVGGGGGGSGTVTTLTAGTGISFSTGSTITTSGTIRARRPLVTSFCAGYTPAASGADTVVIRLPDSPSDGTTAITYEPQEFHVRVETASANTTTIQLEKYTGTGAFSGTAITSVSISGASTYEVQTSVFAGAGIFLTSGDKLRINFTALSASHANFSVYLELEEV